jgi:NifU-like protein involved in Fe-S cluster formation
MAELDAIYSAKILELAAALPKAARLAAPSATATAHSKLCGSTVTIDVSVFDGRITEFAQTVKACLLGQATASVVAVHCLGITPTDMRRVAAETRAMLKSGGSPPTGRWADLAALLPVRDYKARHASTLLVFDAMDRALDHIDAATRSVA